MSTIRPTEVRCRTGGFLKLLLDAVSIFEINAIPYLRHWYVTVLLAGAFPLPWFFVTRTIAPDDPQVLLRLLAGTMVFGVAFSVGMFVGQNLNGQRFLGQLKLLIAMPVSKGAFVLGSLLYASLSGIVTLVVILGFGAAIDLEWDLAWGLIPSLLLAALTMAGLTLFVISFAPTAQVGNLATGLLSLLLAAFSPVYYTMEQAPPVLKQLGYVSPLRYAADGITKSLSGNADVWFELSNSRRVDENRHGDTVLARAN